MPRPLAVALLLLTAATPPAQAQLRFEALPGPLTSEKFGAAGSAWMDIDGDGRVDVAMPGRDSMHARVYLSRGDGFRRLPLQIPLGNGNAAAWGDVDGDGDADLMIAQERLRLFETRAAGDSVELVPFANAGVLSADNAPSGAFEGISFGDIDADGDLDAVVVSWSAAGVFVLLNDGAGSFSVAPRDDFPFASRLGGVHMADLDGDARADLLLTGDPLRDFRTGSFVYWNGAAGWAADRASAFARHTGALGSSLGDVDGDGDLDVFVAGFRPGTASALYFNDGNRSFRRSATTFATTGRVIGSALADFDNDGDLDLMTANGYTDAGPIELWLGDGRGEFARADVPGLSGVSGEHTGLSVVDLDRDGRLDVYVASLGQPGRLLRNVATGDSDWLQVELRAPRGARAFWPARVVAEVVESGRSRQLLRTVHQQTGYGGHGEPVAHFALPRGASLRRIVVTWPDGSSTNVDVTATRRRITVDAPARR